jgi:hypothetical protein
METYACFHDSWFLQPAGGSVWFRQQSMWLYDMLELEGILFFHINFETVCMEVDVNFEAASMDADS